MLRLVRDNTRFDSVEPSTDPRAPRGYDISDLVEGGRHFDDRYGRRRSVAARVGLTVVIAGALACAGAGAYFAAQRGVFDAVVARQDTQSQTPPPVSRPSPQPSEQAARPAGRLPVPDVQSLVVLIRNAVVALHQANTAGNYSVLRDIAAPGFQLANSPASLSGAFASLRSRGIDLSQITFVNPRLYRDPTIDRRGLMHLVGFFPVGSEQVDFDLLFQAVGGHWRLFGIGVNPQKAPGPADGGAAAPKLPQPKPAAEATLPDATTMVALIRASVIALNQANATGNYSVLRDISAPGFRDVNGLAQLGAIFAELRSRQLDLAPVAVIDPKLFRPPAIDQQSHLRLAGYFPSAPEQVNFDLAFQFGDGQWRLFGIGLNTSRQAPAASAAAPPSGDGQGEQGSKAP